MESQSKNPEFLNNAEDFHQWMHFADLSSTIPTRATPTLSSPKDNFCDLVYRIKIIWQN